MDVQFYGANCLVFSTKKQRFVVDDNMAELGAKKVTKEADVSLFTTEHDQVVGGRMTIAMPGEYEIDDVSIKGIQARAHMDEEGGKSAVMYKITADQLNYLVCGHVYPELSERQLESINQVDVMFVPVGGGGYTLDPVGAQKLIRQVEPKLVVPTHYDDKALKYEVPQVSLEQALKELSMEPKETLAKLKLKSTDMGDVTQLIVLQKA
jgi:hypothetical protein